MLTSTLVFKDNGSCYNFIEEYSGWNESKRGRYDKRGDTIFFLIKPTDGYYMTDRMLSDTLLVDEKENRLIFYRTVVPCCHLGIIWDVRYYEIVREEDTPENDEGF